MTVIPKRLLYEIISFITISLNKRNNFLDFMKQSQNKIGFEKKIGYHKCLYILCHFLLSREQIIVSVGKSTAM